MKAKRLPPGEEGDAEDPDQDDDDERDDAKKKKVQPGLLVFRAFIFPNKCRRRFVSLHFNTMNVSCVLLYKWCNFATANYFNNSNFSFLFSPITPYNNKIGPINKYCTSLLFFFFSLQRLQRSYQIL